MKRKRGYLSSFLVWSCQMAGKPITFVVALGVLLLWFIIGIFFEFSSYWLLVIDTIATINASLMVFIIQNTQNREMKALHIKLDGLIRSTKEAKRELIAIEEMEEEELENIRRKIFNENP